MQTQSEFRISGTPISSPDKEAPPVNLQFDFIETIVPSSPLDSASAIPSSKFGFAAKRPLEILVVDDNKINRKVVRAILERLGYQSREACGGKEALAMISSHPINYVFTDLDMPGMGGIETATEIRSLESQSNSTRKTEIVAVTANISKESRRRCREAGMNGFLEKPITPKAIKSQLLRSWARIRPQKRPPANVNWGNYSLFQEEAPSR